MLKDYKGLSIERDYLEGNLNRMCVTSEKKELDSMYEYAKKRIDAIYEYNVNRLENRSK